MSRILVTGAAGFLGKAVVKELLKRPDTEIFATGRGPAGSFEDTFPRSPRLVVIPEVDLSNPRDLERIPNGLTHVVHAAGLARFEGATRASLNLANVTATHLLIRHLQSTSGSTLRRFLFTSTIGVHDRPAFVGVSGPIRESSPLSPKSEYGRSKLEAEKIVRDARLPAVVARLTWIYGPQMRCASHIRVLGQMAFQGSAASKMEWPGRVTVGFIDDVGEAIVALLCKDKLEGDTFLIGHQEPVSFAEMFALFHKMTGSAVRPMVPASILRPLRIFSPLLPMKLRGLLEDYYVADVGSLAREGIALKTSFADGIVRSVGEGGWFKK